jgi:hypothetical protein
VCRSTRPRRRSWRCWSACRIRSPRSVSRDLTMLMVSRAASHKSCHGPCKAPPDAIIAHHSLALNSFTSQTRHAETLTPHTHTTLLTPTDPPGVRGRDDRVPPEVRPPARALPGTSRAPSFDKPHRPRHTRRQMDGDVLRAKEALIELPHLHHEA